MPWLVLTGSINMTPVRAMDMATEGWLAAMAASAKATSESATGNLLWWSGVIALRQRLAAYGTSCPHSLASCASLTKRKPSCS